MKTIILAGGFGTRLSEYTEKIPKPMVQIGGKPILWHIMNHYASYGHKDFILALGYKAELIKEYFLNYKSLNSDLSIDLASGLITYLNSEKIEWKVQLIQTGLGSMTGERLRRLKAYVRDEAFLLTYGDGVTDVNIQHLIDFHKKHNKTCTLTSVRPSARFGDLEFDGDKVTSFVEKPQIHEGWINGGFFVCEPEVFNFIEDHNEMFEREPIDRLVKAGELMAYKHTGFWHSMDTKRDHDRLEKLWGEGAPWTNKGLQ